MQGVRIASVSRGPGIVWFPVITATMLDLKCWRALFPPASLWAPKGNIQHRHSGNLPKLVTHISELVYKALHLLGRGWFAFDKSKKRSCFVSGALCIFLHLPNSSKTPWVCYESLEKAFECFSHIITAELEWCHGKNIFRETAISQFFFFCW